MIFVIIIIIITLFLLIFYTTTLINSGLGPFLKNRISYDDSNQPLISILIPARNEERNIRRAVESAFSQDYPNFEVIVLNDNSTDKTSEILLELSLKYPKLIVANGRELPHGWTGKNWACYQLAQYALGEILIFTDADNWYEKFAARATIAYMKKYKVSFLSAFPQQIKLTFAENLIIPMIDLIIYSFLILWTAYYFKNKNFSAANGQWIAVTKEAYFKTYGHMQIKNQIVEDVALAKMMKIYGYKTMVMAGTNAIYGRMYTTFSEIWNGLSKNLYSLSRSFWLLTSLTIILIAVSFIPIYLIFTEYYYFGYLLLFLLISWKLLLSLVFKSNPLINIFLHHFQIIIFLGIAFNSFVLSKTGKITWKGRNIKIDRFQ